MNIKQIIKEEIDSFDWVDEVPPKLTPDQLVKGDMYIYKLRGRQFRLKYSHPPGITNKWGTTTTYAFDWVNDGQNVERINFEPKNIQGVIDKGDIIKESNDFDWVGDVDGYDDYTINKPPKFKKGDEVTLPLDEPGFGHKKTMKGRVENIDFRKFKGKEQYVYTLSIWKTNKLLNHSRYYKTEDEILNYNPISRWVHESNDFDWAEEADILVDIDLSNDYLEIWPKFEEMFADLGVPWIGGHVQSNDYDGEMMLEIRSEDFMVDVVITQVFHEDDEGNLITYEMYDPDEYDRTRIKDSYVPGGDYLKPVIDKLREFVVGLIDDYKTIQT